MGINMLLPRHDELLLIIRFIRKQTHALEYIQTDAHTYIPKKNYESSMANVLQFFFRFCFHETSTLSRVSPTWTFIEIKLSTKKPKSDCRADVNRNTIGTKHLLAICCEYTHVPLYSPIHKWQPRDCEQYRALSSCDLKEFWAWSMELSSRWSLRFEGLDRILLPSNTASVLTVELLNAWRLRKVDRERTYEGSM